MFYGKERDEKKKKLGHQGEAHLALENQLVLLLAELLVAGNSLALKQDMSS